MKFFYGELNAFTLIKLLFSLFCVNLFAHPPAVKFSLNSFYLNFFLFSIYVHILPALKLLRLMSFLPARFLFICFFLPSLSLPLWHYRNSYSLTIDWCICILKFAFCFLSFVSSFERTRKFVFAVHSKVFVLLSIVVMKTKSIYVGTEWER